MYAVAASFAALYLLVGYLSFRGPSQNDGIEAGFAGGATEIRFVQPGSRADRAGLRDRDTVVAIDGQRVRNPQDWAAVRANTVVDRPQKWEVVRRGQRLVLDLVPEHRQWDTATFITLQYAFVAGCYLAVGLFIAFRRPRDPVARLGAWFVAAASMAIGMPNGWAVVWRELPIVVQALLWVPQLSRFVVEAIFLSFAATFPQPLFRARWPWLLIWAPALATLPWRLGAMYSVIHEVGQARGAPPWVTRVTLARTIVYLAAAVVILVLNYRRLDEPNQRRRMRVLLAGTVLAVAAGILLAWNIQTQGVFLSVGFPIWATMVPLILACPLAFAYSILRHRVFDIQVIVRRGLQYALARGAILGIVPALASILLVDLTLRREQTLASVLSARGWVYGVLLAPALLIQLRRKEWLETLDRRFFREHYDAQRVLREVVEEIRRARSFHRVAPVVAARIESALHPEFAALMVREPDEPAYRRVASSPAGAGVQTVAADSKLVALARVLGSPLEVLHSESRWLDERIPRGENDALRQTGIDLLVPVPSGSGRAEALLALGAKRSEEPYSREDRELLEAIATSLSLLLEQPAAEPERAPSPKFDECPTCGVCYDSGFQRCPDEGEGLVPVHLPRVLVGRYRLERRRGRGGMGAVYEATDSSLERRVAVKVMRDDLVGSASAAERFRREARAAASFTHPNVVTVYDFGVEAQTRAFLVMELLQGATLREELSKHRRLDTVRTLRILRSVCAAVEAAHRRQLIHRDLKPENIFLTRDPSSPGADETAKVLDFGIAKFATGPDQSAETRTLGADTGPGVLLGTPAYMSPEQLLGESVGPHWDLWSLGVVAYEMLTGALPFGTTLAPDWRRNVLNCNYTPVEHHVPGAKPRLDEFFAVSLASSRDRRPASAQEFVSGLEQAFA
jgi:tRNA A-37 threonylcarbamoyl transferase component Bud32